jgi:hypothetical protein
MRTLAYISRARRALDPHELGDLLDDARRFNAEHGLTGVLLHDHGMFLQLLEVKRSPSTTRCAASAAARNTST